ncbi:MAG TPA: DNA repair protein RecN [Membranihabitans sp.]|nr:DNA repair protein RecN [Membranihabitans sp.]
MLKSLYIKNFVLIDEITIDFSSHLTTITGETGAGKSILLGALNLILGQRADTSTVADEDKTTVIEGSFDLQSYKLQSYFDSEELDYKDETILRREIRSNGKSRAFVNDNLVNLSTLKSLADHLIDIHEQFDSHFLRDRNFKFQVIDSLAGQSAEVDAYRKLYSQWKKLKAELKALQEKQISLSQKKDFLEFQLNEINQLNYQDGEFAELEAQLNLVRNSSDILEIISMADHMFEGAENNLLDQFRSLIVRLSSIKVEMDALKNLKDRLESNYIELEDLHSEITQLEDLVEMEPASAERIESRMADIFKVIKKHHLTEASELSVLTRQLQSELNEIDQTDSQTATLESEIDRLTKKLKLEADQISAKRAGQTKPIRQAVLDLLSLLNLDKSDFQVEVVQTEILNDFGQDEIRFLFSANPGVPLAPVEKVASGGEISRLALSIKALIARSIPLPTIVFDEIDSGVSGSAADKMGTVLYNLGRHHQVICITHSPQVASRADKHLFVYKEMTEDKSETRIRDLKRDERITELAIMMSSDPPSSTALENAKYLLEKTEIH